MAIVLVHMPIDLGCSVRQAGGPDERRLDRKLPLQMTIETPIRRLTASRSRLHGMVAALE
jgi:hypothetical protein